MGYDRGDNFPFDFEPNEIPFGSKSKGKLPPRSYPIQYERKWQHSFLSVHYATHVFISVSIYRREKNLRETETQQNANDSRTQQPENFFYNVSVEFESIEYFDKRFCV